MSHIERKTELKRRRKRREKVHKLRRRLVQAKNPTEQAAIVAKIRILSPFWNPPEAVPSGRG
jgi:hypothetical protein